MSRRTNQVQDLLRSEISSLIMHKIRDPRVHMATVASAKVSPDFSHAVIWISALGDEQERNETILALRHAKGFIRTQLARRLKLRTVPDLVFELDRGAEQSQHMSDLLEGLHDNDPRT